MIKCIMIQQIFPLNDTYLANLLLQSLFQSATTNTFKFIFLLVYIVGDCKGIYLPQFYQTGKRINTTQIPQPHITDGG